MPYINKEARPKWQETIDEVVKTVRNLPIARQDGELNYLITSIVKGVYDPKYFHYNRAIGMLDCVRQEFYRRVVAPYEDVKIEENGDV